MELEEVKQLAKELKDATAGLNKQQDELKEANKLAMKAIEDAKSMDKTTTENVDKAISKANESGEMVKELAVKLDEAIKKMKAGPQGPVTLRQQLAKQIGEGGELNVQYKQLADRTAKHLKLKTTIDTGAVAGIVPNPYVDTLISMAQQPLRVRSLLNVIPVQTDSVRYGVQNVRNNAAAVVAEGASKPYSNYAWTNATATVEVIAHLAKLTLQAIADAPRLVAEIEAEMRYGLALVEEGELLNGNGTTGHMSGLLHNATQYQVPVGTDTSLILNQVDRLRVAILQLHLAYVVPNGQVLNPIDMANIELIRRDASTKDGGYIFGNPDSQRSTKTLWNLPVVESVSMAVGNFLTGDFQAAASLYQREGVEVLISTENNVDFEQNLATMRCELREGLAVRRPYALVKGTFVEEGS